ncbi:hypothetical protein BS50DRAFT_677267 [Corynespora cassiicola Philippines]|uniref:Serine/threonine-protein kinase Tel1 n=1 Tax=Corynespora cassiicola Philippines TaxID=1448308 RepID=A0A2T2NKP1_CORCC|nr:hypothetical protein BS50DRAFT_677267 [Corynespora cassiicola Philippines]
MGVTNIQDAKVYISSTKVPDRLRGLKDLIHILRHNRGKSSLDGLGNKAYLALFESLFKCLREERASYRTSKSKNTKNSKTAALLPLCAEALRQVINAGVRTIKSSTVEYVIGEILEVLPGPDKKLLEPLLGDLPRALRSLFEYQPHVERLSLECWDDTVDFCVKALLGFLAEQEPDVHNSWSTAMSSRGRTPIESTDAASRPSPRDPSTKARQIPEGLAHAADDFVNCLHMLVKASNAPILDDLDRTEAIHLVLLKFLQHRSGRGSAAALSAINALLSRLAFHSIDLTRRILTDFLPLAKTLWSDHTLRDELIIAFMLTETHIATMVADKTDDQIGVTLEALVDVMYGEYRRRQEFGSNQFLEEDSLCFRHTDEVYDDTHPLSTFAFSLETAQQRSEGHWATVLLIARFSSMLDERNNATAHDRPDGEESFTKRLRVTYHFKDYLRHVSEPRSNARRAALQVIAFMVQDASLSEEDIQTTLEKLTALISDENPVHSSWAMIALAAAAFQKKSAHPSLVPYWNSAWQTASRVVTSLSCSRSACHLMDLLLRLKVVLYPAVSETVQNMLLSIELSGPGLFSDASSSLLTTIIHERIAENPTHHNQTAERALNWLLSKWTPSLWPERTYTQMNAHHCHAFDVLQLLHACLDRPFQPVKPPPFMVLGPIAQAQMHFNKFKDLSEYLLLKHSQRDFQVLQKNTYAANGSDTDHGSTQMVKRILDFCVSELDKTRQRWKEWSQQNTQGINADMMRIVANLCIVASALATFGESFDRRVSNLESATDSLAQIFVDLLKKPQTEQYKVDAVLEVCSKNLPDIRHVEKLSSESFKSSGICLLARHLSKALKSRKELKQSFYPEEDDFMDMDDAANSQMTNSICSSDIDVPRHIIQAATDSLSLRASCSAYLHLVASLEFTPDRDQETIPQDLVDSLMLFNDAELVCCRPFLVTLLSTHFQLSRSSCFELLERLSERLLHPSAKEFNTSEVANGMVVEVLVGTTLVWGPESTEPEAEELYENVEALYDYYVKNMEKGGVRRSAGLQMAIADFLHGLLRHHPDFGQTRKMPSIRTSLFELLGQGEITVKYHIAERLPDVFEDFVLNEHDKILEDVDSSLPREDVWIEGIAIRLLVLSRLAARWHTLLRQSVYRIFATAGSVMGAVRHAKQCISDVANARHLDDSPSLFRLFAPQIIFTWLDRKRPFSEIPYLTFGYSTLEELLSDIESEAIGQAMMLGLKDEVEYLARLLGMETAEALTKNIGKAAAYTISWDTCKGNARNKAVPSSATMLRDILGQKQYHELVQRDFPQILGYIFQTMDHEERLSKQLEKRPAYASAAKSLAEMNNVSHSTQDLNIGIEPAFSAFYLLDQLERLCRRAQYESINFWTPGSYTFVMRMLLDRLHPALGSLYARSIIRKVRVLVALAGPVAYKGYPLQMTLQSLRPFLTDIQCAEDTLGVVQYLFQNGSEYLREHLSFVAGIGLSTLISIRVFLGSSQESTTQQSQHTTTMNKAQKFHAWLTQYLKSYSESLPENENIAYVKAFRLITAAASQVRTEGNSIRGSEESKLLLEILEDVRSGRKLLNNTSREVALNLLCQNFQPALTARDDILGADADAAKYAAHVWESCRRGNVGEGYLLWVAKVLGRAFSAYGEVQRNTMHTLPWTLQRHSSKDSLGRGSREAIFMVILDLFYSDDRAEVGLAEDAMRNIISGLSGTDKTYVDELARLIPDSIGQALGGHTLERSRSDLKALPSSDSLEQAAFPKDKMDEVVDWVKDISIRLCEVASPDPILGALSQLLTGIKNMAEKLFPYILHLVLLGEFEGQRSVRALISEAAMAWFCDPDKSQAPYIRIIIQAILYLRSQPTPKEVTRVDRDHWLEIDHLKASQAAAICGMYRSALLFAETSSGQPIVKTTSRRSSTFVAPPKLPIDLQLSIYKNLDEPDSFYGVDRGSSLSSVLDRLDYEGDGMKSLLFRGARMDSQTRQSNIIQSQDSRGTIKSLVTLNMNSITHSLLSNNQFRDLGDDAVDKTLHTARKLGQWDIKAPETNRTEASTLFKAFQGLHHAKDVFNAKKVFDRQFLATMGGLSSINKSSASIKAHLRTLAILTESDEVLATMRPEHLLDAWDKMKAREKWMRAGEFDDVRQLLSCRETLFGVLSTNLPLLESLRVRRGLVRQMEVESLILSSTICRKHGALQESLASVTYLSDIVQHCKSMGLDIETTAQHEVASVLWDQGEAETSIRMRQNLIEHATFDSQATEISLPVLLAKLGHHLAEARLAKPDAIMEEYLEKAILELKGQTQGAGPGQVFHEFASFCDKQLQSPEAAEDMERVKTVMERKLQEYNDFVKLANTDKSKSMRETYRRSAMRAKNWYNLDHAEYERLRKGREEFLRQCLENYLLSLQASDEFDNDALRVFSLWLENSDSPLANEAVGLHLKLVPSGKFALLMNQLSSRLQAENTEFQNLLNSLVFRICKDHPYHGMHQIFAIQMKVGPITREDVVRAKDESARSRQAAATQIATLLKNDQNARHVWNAVYQSDEIFHALAMVKNDQDNKSGREYTLERYPESKMMAKRVPGLKVPPATLQIEVRANMDYSDLPKIAGFRSKMSIANGLSAPKVITAVGTDGKQYKQLFKSGNDDLRQDAIMEQVFDQVSRLLKNHTATRLRNLGIRTYKVLPLSTRSGLMEFVQNTIPLHLWVMPAHEKYYPNDWKPDKCRKEIGACQGDTMSTRTKVWQKIADHFHPVLRYFLLERFEDPDEWFERRLAYTRSTAAISILGHVLGLGDRHCHNILLDEKTGEVVHIDLGVSFEAGRVLPVPEVVPFRLTRDLVDAMGYTKTEGVFRRCCEFTMDTLREERESIMTLLNVLRYDPLVNWSVTPTKAKRMQEGQDTNATRSGTIGPGGTPVPSGQMPPPYEEAANEGDRKREEQAGEAGRALSVVEKKLSKTLSTRATVNELIQAATDEKNLAVLYMGWASYA